MAAEKWDEKPEPITVAIPSYRLAGDSLNGNSWNADRREPPHGTKLICIRISTRAVSTPECKGRVSQCD